LHVGRAHRWDQAIADLIAYTETGVVARRFVMPFANLGMRLVETPAGLRVTEVSTGGVAHQAGVVSGDLLLTAGGAPVYRIGELWAVSRVVGRPRAAVELQWVHAGERRSGSGRVAHDALTSSV
jgi:C-terminal processing protease CtpA/Prc